MSQGNEWNFEKSDGYGYAGTLKLGPFHVAKVFHTAGVAINDYVPGKFSEFGTVEFAERIAKVLNRELPEGKFRVRRKRGVK